MSIRHIPPDWITATAGGRALGVSANTFTRCAPVMGIRTLVIPGRRGAYYHRADILAAVAELERQSGMPIPGLGLPVATRASENGPRQRELF